MATRINPEILQVLEEDAVLVAKSIDLILEGQDVAWFVWMNRPGGVEATFLSNVDRHEMIPALRQLVAKLEEAEALEVQG